jgi:hypothetical protein
MKFPGNWEVAISTAAGTDYRSFRVPGECLATVQ